MTTSTERHLTLVAGHEPTEETRDLVRTWTDIGATKELIARELRIHMRALDHHYPDELAGGDARGVARVAAALYAKACAGDVAAQTFYLKTRGRRAGWIDREEDQRDHVSQLDVVDAVLKTVALLKGQTTRSEAQEVLDARVLDAPLPGRGHCDDGSDLL